MNQNHKTRAEGNAPSRNATKHGLRSAMPLIQGESAEELAELREGLMADFKPVGRLELELAERAVSCFWRLRRISNLEAEVLDELARIAEQSNLIDTGCTLDQKGQGYYERQWVEEPAKAESGKLFLETEERKLANLLEGLERSVGRGLVCGRAEPALTLLRRYESSLDRCLASTLAQLDRIQSARRREERERQATESVQPQAVRRFAAEPETAPETAAIGVAREGRRTPIVEPAIRLPEDRESEAVEKIRRLVEAPGNWERLVQMCEEDKRARAGGG